MEAAEAHCREQITIACGYGIIHINVLTENSFEDQFTIRDTTLEKDNISIPWGD